VAYVCDKAETNSYAIILKLNVYSSTNFQELNSAMENAAVMNSGFLHTVPYKTVSSVAVADLLKYYSCS